MYKLNHCFCLRTVIPCFFALGTWEFSWFTIWNVAVIFNLGEERENVLMSKQKVIEKRLHGSLFT